jgi:lipoprotein-anchoring transpeptidase ErfK/SrfK
VEPVERIGSTGARREELSMSSSRNRSKQIFAGAVLAGALTLVGTSAAAPAGASTPVERKTPSYEHTTARTAAPIPVFSARGDENAVGILSPTTEFGTQRVLLVLKERGEWLKVRLPDRPNGTVGWIHTSDVELRTVTDKIDIDLSARVLRWYRDGRLVLETPVAIGAPDTPTPTGRTYITDLLDTPDGGSYGPFAAGVALHSNELSEFGGGDGQIGIHGTSDPSSIGQAVSHGCVRVPNEVITQLATSLPLGVPVTII